MTVILIKFRTKPNDKAIFCGVLYKDLLLKFPMQLLFCHLAEDVLYFPHLNNLCVFRVAIQTNMSKCYFSYYASSLRAMTLVHDLQDEAGGITPTYVIAIQSM